jgi:hypothetical protein
MSLARRLEAAGRYSFARDLDQYCIGGAMAEGRTAKDDDHDNLWAYEVHRPRNPQR